MNDLKVNGFGTVECEYCNSGFDEEGEPMHWWKQENPKCPTVIAMNQRDEDDQARNDFHHG